MSVFESFWQNKSACDDAERAYYEKLSGCKVNFSLISSYLDISLILIFDFTLVVLNYFLLN